ncbi:DUF2513 domain-containing protein [Paenibacillus polymyxa]|uniref:DUF2513 domain-containing protein n=1 Tax=Paenibacillus polymyxa TaxID=1406 RepID=UPI002ED44C8C|nr:DUF2513 domain-containing protein [Paenibacillus polymyxa]
MQLKHDLVRNVLLTIESNEYGTRLTQSNFKEAPLLTDCDLTDFVYTVERLYEAGFIDAEIAHMAFNSVSVRVKSITWSGHQFLDNIRDNKVWSETKKISSKVASVSLGILSEVAASYMKKTLGLE